MHETLRKVEIIPQTTHEDLKVLEHHVEAWLGGNRKVADEELYKMMKAKSDDVGEKRPNNINDIILANTSIRL